MKYKRKKRGGNTNETKLTPRESLILSLIASGFSDDDIANSLFLSVRTVNRHIENIREKLESKSRAHAVAKSLRFGLLSFDEIEKTAETYATQVAVKTAKGAISNNAFILFMA